MAKAQAPDAPIDETNITRSLTLELDRQPLDVPDGAAPAALNSGVLRVGPIGCRPADRDARAISICVAEPASPSDARGGAGGQILERPAARATVTIRGRSTRRCARSTSRAWSRASRRKRSRARAIGLRGSKPTCASAPISTGVLKAERFLDGREAEIAAYEAEQARLNPRRTAGAWRPLLKA